MKRRNLFIVIIFVVVGVFAIYSFNRYPKKIVANILYTIDDRVLDFADDYFYGIGLKEMLFKIKENGDYTFNAEIKKGNKRHLLLYNTENATNKSKSVYEIKDINGDLKHRGEKIINNEVFLYRPEISEKFLYIDTNTMKTLSENSNALKDLGYDINNENLFSYPIPVIEKNNNLKKYVKKEWNRILRSTSVVEINENKYEIRVNTDDLRNLIEKVSDFYELEDNNLYFFLLNNLKIEKESILENLKYSEEIYFYLSRDKDNIFRLNSEDMKYNLVIGDVFSLQIPGRNIYIAPEENEIYNTVKGRINDRHFRMSYDPNKSILYYHDEYSKINAKIYKNKAKPIKFISDINGMKFSKINFLLKSSADKIEKEKDYIEILKLDEKRWNELKSGESK